MKITNFIFSILPATTGYIFRVVVLFFVIQSVSQAHEQINLVDLVKQVKPSVVSIAKLTPLYSKAPDILGTGFVVGNGKYIVTNYHVVSAELDTTIVQYYVALSGEGQLPKVHKTTVIDVDPVHDLAILSIEATLPTLALAGDTFVDAGTNVAMTGYPIGAVLGLYPATHTGIVAAIAPDANPARNADDLTINMLKRLKEPFLIYQLDITAFPGNSGSPVYDRNTGDVIGVLNKVFVSEAKEAALTNPSGISYAIPAKEVRALAKKNNIEL